MLLDLDHLEMPDDSFMSFLLQSPTHHLNTIETSALSSSTTPGVSLLLKPDNILLTRLTLSFARQPRYRTQETHSHTLFYVDVDNFKFF